MVKKGVSFQTRANLAKEMIDNNNICYWALIDGCKDYAKKISQDEDTDDDGYYLASWIENNDD